MKAIVTGGEGFIGGRLVERLCDAGWMVLSIDDYSTHKSKHVNQRARGATLLQGRVQDTTIPSKFWGADAIFHLAGKLGPVGVLKFRGEIARDTIDAAYKVGRWAALDGCPLIDVSTSEVYGSPDEANSEETDKVFRQFTARSEYAISKLAAENMLVNSDDVDVRIIRPFNVTGAGQRPEGGFVIPRFIQQALRGERMTVYSPGTQRRSFTHVDDIIDGMLLALQRGKTNEVYNLGNPNNTRTMMQIADLVAERLQVEMEYYAYIVDPTELHGPDFKEAPEKIPNADKAKRELDFRPYRDIETIIDESIRWEMFND